MSLNQIKRLTLRSSTFRWTLALCGLALALLLLYTSFALPNHFEKNDRDQAEALAGAIIAIQREQLPELEDAEFYWADLIGLAVQTQEGVELGHVDHLFETGSNDVVVVKGDRERLIPFVMDQVIQSVDLESRLMVVDWDPEF